MASTLSTLKPEEVVAPPPEPEDNDDFETNEISSDEDGKMTTSSDKKRSAPASALDDDKKAERRAANRRSAFQSRQRRKILIEDLQRTVAALSKDNTDLRKTNDELRVHLEASMLENQQFRMQQQLGGPGKLYPGGPSLQSAQAQALLRGGADQSSLSHLLAISSNRQMGNSGASANNDSSRDNSDPLANTRFALASARSQNGDRLNQRQASTADSAHQSIKGRGTSSPGSSSTHNPQSNGIQGILHAASLSSAPGAAGLQGLYQQESGLNPQLSGLQAMLERGGASVHTHETQFSGSAIQALGDQLRGKAGAHSLPADFQQALLQGSHGAGENKNAVSNALRSLLQKNNI